MEKEIDYSKVPYQYPLCLNRQCTKATTCLRQMAERSMPDNTVRCTIINPRHIATLDGDCPFYRPNVRVRYAKGFIGILNNLPYKQMQGIINSLMAYFGRRTYFRVRKGERLLSPPEQQYIIDILKKWNLTHPQEFDAYAEDYDW